MGERNHSGVMETFGNGLIKYLKNIKMQKPLNGKGETSVK